MMSGAFEPRAFSMQGLANRSTSRRARTTTVIRSTTTGHHSQRRPRIQRTSCIRFMATWISRLSRESESFQSISAIPVARLSRCNFRRARRGISSCTRPRWVLRSLLKTSKPRTLPPHALVFSEEGQMSPTRSVLRHLSTLLPRCSSDDQSLPPTTS
jgi:hypothetical protein